MRGVAPRLFGKPLLGKGLTKLLTGQVGRPCLIGIQYSRESPHPESNREITLREGATWNPPLRRLFGTLKTVTNRHPQATRERAPGLQSRAFLDTISQVHGARCLKPRPLITDKARSYGLAPKPSPQCPVDQGRARCAPLDSPPLSRSTERMLFVSSPQLGLLASHGITHVE
jgi:hypothetical protein